MHSYFKALFEKHEKAWRKNIKKEHWRKSTPRKILQVHERIKFTDFLEDQIGEEFQTNLYYPQLITYLRLTCFDHLGQPVKYSNFENWLKSKKQKAKSEKIEVLEAIESSDPIEIAKTIFSGYQVIYGSKNSFFNFINNVISSNQRASLTNSIQIRITNDNSPTLKGRTHTDADKLTYLYRIRNDFTHNTYSRDSKLINREAQKEWISRERIFEGDNEIWISTSRDFQDVLKESVLNGISELIKTEYGM